MYDLLLTDKGDIVFDEIENTKKLLEIDFVVSTSKVLNLDFYTENLEDKKYEKGLMIEFYIAKRLHNKKDKGVTDNAYKEQQIRIRLNTVLGTLEGNENIGSRLQLLKHKLVDDSRVEADLRKYITEAISDIVADPIIEIKQSETAYLNYTNNLEVTIIDSENKYKYTLL